MTRSAVSLFVRPRTFFEDGRRSRSLAWPAAVVLLSALLPVAVNYATTVSIGLRGEWYVPTDLGPSLAIAAVGSAIAAVASWLLFTAVLYVLTAVLGGSGGFRPLLAAIGWGFLPMVLSTLLRFALSGLPVPFAAYPTVLLIGYVWSAALWVAGVRATRRVSTVRAVVAVALPLVLTIGTAAIGFASMMAM